ncbi:gamma-glutamyltransferase [Arthrobacter sp. 260]|uniref:gamma-glutamyltransferase family protein n=1 Tax=Arthrobacter sp. 260 TaxID=2735314 RepID=UPI001C0FBFA7
MRRSIPRIPALIALVAMAVIAVVVVVSLTGNRQPGAAPTVTPATTDAQESPATPSPIPVTTSPEPEPSPDLVEAVVSSHSLATDAGAAILDAGGTAADASVAMAAVLSVVEPFYSSALGGDTWGLYYDADAEAVTSVNGVGPAGSGATLADYGPRAGTPGMHQAIVPGAWDGWMVWLGEYGTMDLDEVLAPAISLARNGYPVSTEMSYWLGVHENEIRASPVMSNIYIREGSLSAPGQTIYQNDLADTFEALASAYDEALPSGRSEAVTAARDYFYRGPIADSIVAFSEQSDGYLTAEDLSSFEAEIVDPIELEYTDDITIYQNPPNSQGIAMLEALSILREDNFSSLSPDDPAVVHTQIEAIKLAYADRYALVGDPDRAPVPVAELLSEDYAAAQRSRIDPDTAAEWPIDSGIERSASDTTTFHVADSFGNAAAVTTSIGGHFLVVGDTGIHINERMRFMSLEEGNVNVVAPGATVRHTSNPYLALRDGKPYLLGGNTGIDTQPQGQLQQFMSVVDFGLSPTQAIARPRFVSTAFPASTFPYAANNVLDVESSLPQTTIDGLRARGHDVVVGQGIFGTASMLEISPDGLSAEAASEPRNDTASSSVTVPD